MLDPLAAQGEREGRRYGLCYRCGKDPDTEHDGSFCPAFADYAESGKRLSFNDILRAIRKLSKKTVSAQPTCRVEEFEGPAGEWHQIVGLAADGRYAGRFDAPWMPEFSIWSGSERVYDADAGSIAGRSDHKMLYKGWRSALRDTAGVFGIRLSDLGKELRVNLDRSTEEVARFKSSYL